MENIQTRIIKAKEKRRILALIKQKRSQKNSQDGVKAESDKSKGGR